jgi:hypothetical protein
MTPSSAGPRGPKKCVVDGCRAASAPRAAPIHVGRRSGVQWDA